MYQNNLLETAQFSPNSLQSPNAWVGHLPFAAWLIKEISPKIFVELGTHTANSYFSFCQSTSEQHLVTKCFAVDTWQGDEHAGMYGDEVFNQVNAHNQAHYQNFSRLLRMTFDDAVGYFSDNSIDLLHIDGLHTYEAVRHDFETWLPKLAPGAIVLFHDTNVRERNFGVWKLWQELQARYPNNLEFLHSNGLGVLQLDGAVGIKKLNWLDSIDMEQNELKDYFSALGIRQLERFELGQIKTQVTYLNQDIAERDGQIANLSLALADRDGQIANLSLALADRDREILSLTDKFSYILLEKDHKSYAQKQELNAILHSRSWQITGPLRKISSLLTKLSLVNFFFIKKLTEFIKIRCKLVQKSSILEIHESSLFNADFYLATYPDVRNNSIDPVIHYFFYGWKELRDPSALFNTALYLTNNPDVAKSGVNPLLHYLKHGQQEGRQQIPKPIPFEELHVTNSKLIPKVSVADLDVEIEAISKSGLFDETFYRSTYKDLNVEPFNAIRHYCEHGWREGRNPSQDFDTRFYLETYSDIHNAGINPFWHYIVAGALELRNAMPMYEVSEQVYAEIEAIRKSGLFDEFFYRSMYTEQKPEHFNAIRHYCELGWKEGRNPSDDFDTRSYLATYSDIRDAGINPFWHYVVAGASELRYAVPPLSATRYENDIWFGVVDSDIKLLANYVSPDWAMLSSCQSISKGISQPLMPQKDFEFYDPLDCKVLKKQAQTAKLHGIYGFCFQLKVAVDGLEKSQPVETFVDHDDIDLRFCVQVDLGPHGIEPVIEIMLKVLSDKRYIHIEGRPVILVTISNETQHADVFLGYLKREFAKRGIFNTFLIAQFRSTSNGNLGTPLGDLCDAVLDLPIMPVPGETGDFLPTDKAGADVVPYCVIASQGVARAQAIQNWANPTYHIITLGRNNTAQKPARSLIYTRFHIEEYRRWLDAAISSVRVAHPADRRFVFVNAWNDWNEGLFLEPDKQSGFGRLNETTRALLNIATNVIMPKVSVIVPNYNHERFLRRRLNSIYGQTYKNIEVILLDDSSTDQSRTVLDQYSANYPEITRSLYNETNSGSAFRQWARGIKLAKGDIVWIAESDDFCDENFLEILVRCFEDEAVMLAYAKSIFVDLNEAPIQDDFAQYLGDLPCVAKWNAPYVDTAHNEVRTALGIKNTIPNASGVIFKRPVDIALLDDESWLSMAVAGDWTFYLHVIRGGKIAYTTETTNFFRRYEGSTAESSYKKEVFYRELGKVAMIAHELYDLPLKVLEQCQKNCKILYDFHLGQSDEEFLLWFDRESIIQARENRLPNIMVSTMGFYPGGAEILPIRLANEFKRQGHSVILFSAGFNHREDGVRRMLRNDVPLIETSEVGALKEIIHDFGIEVLNTHQWHIQKYPLQVPDVFDDLGAHVASLHGMIEHGDSFGVTEKHLRKADQKVTSWVYTAEKNLGPFSNFELFDKLSARFVKLPNGMQPPEITPIPRLRMNIPDEAFVLCCVSRAIPDKGWSESILAVEQARKLSGCDIRLILVGNGPVYDEFCRIGTPDFVYLAGFSENSVGHYAAADMGIMLTKFKSESFPLTIVDCLFAGKPYIATDVGDIKNILMTEGNIVGEVIELESWEVPINRAAQVIAAFASDKDKYESVRTRVQEVANRYRIDAVAEQYVQLFKRDLFLSRCMKIANVVPQIH